MFEQRSRARAGNGRTGRSSELDELNLGLDPTQATIEQVSKAVASARPREAPAPDEVRRAADDSIRAMMLIRTYRVRGHLAADLDPLGLSRMDVPADLTPDYHGFTEADLDRPIFLVRHARLRAGHGPRDRARAAGNLLRPHRLRIHAHLGRRGAPLPPGADRGRRRDGPVHARGQAVDPDQGDRRRAVGEIPRPQICRDQALRPRRRRKRDSRARGGDQIWRLSAASRRSTSAWPTAAGSTSSPTSWASPTARSSTSSRAARPIRPMSAARATSNITSAPRPTASSTGSRSICRFCPTRRTSRRSIRSCSARPARCRRSRATSQGDTVLPMLLHGDAAFAGQGVVWECLSFSGLARLRHRRHHPFHHQQPGRLHHQPAVRALLALSVGRRQGRPGADPPRQRRRSRSGDLLLQAGDRVPPDASTATSSSTCGATAASATTRATSRASPSR